jgi:hypothetical protein
MFWIGSIASLAFAYLGINFVRHYIGRILRRELDCWFDVIRFILIPIASAMVAIGYVQSERKRNVAQQSLLQAESDITILREYGDVVRLTYLV